MNSKQFNFLLKFLVCMLFIGVVEYGILYFIYDDSSSTQTESISKKFIIDNSKIPIIISPIFFPPTNIARKRKTYSIKKFSSATIDSVRTLNPHRRIIVITNMKPTDEDIAYLTDNFIDVYLDHDILTTTLKLLSNTKKFRSICSTRKEEKIFQYFSIFGVERWFWVEGVMKYLSFDMALFLESDNLLTVDIDELESVYKPKDYAFVHPFVSPHISFVSREYVQALNAYSLGLASYVMNRNNTCPFSGGGQDMRLLYEGARYLQKISSDDAKVLNSFSIMPCGGKGDLKGHNWEYNVCNSKVPEDGGPCDKRLNQYIFEYNQEIFQKTKFPYLYECRSQNNGFFRPMSLMQMNLKGGTTYMSPTRRDYSGDSLTLQISYDWSCPHNPSLRSIKNAVLYFQNGSAYGKTAMGYVKLYNIHFQGGGCKSQSKSVLAAMQRSRKLETCFTCDGGFNRTLNEVENCLIHGVNMIHLPKFQ